MTQAIVYAQEILACLETALAAGPAPILPQHVMLRAGQEVTPLLSTTDDECCRGLGWVRVQSVSGVRQIGERDNVTCFQAERVLTLELGVARCAPTPDAGSIPTEDQWTAVALQLDADHGSMEAAVCCFIDMENPGVEEFAVGSYEPFGVDGNCVGGRMTVQVRMKNCC